VCVCVTGLPLEISARLLKRLTTEKTRHMHVRLQIYICVYHRAAVGDLRALIEKIDNAKDETFKLKVIRELLHKSQSHDPSVQWVTYIRSSQWSWAKATIQPSNESHLDYFTCTIIHPDYSVMSRRLVKPLSVYVRAYRHAVFVVEHLGSAGWAACHRVCAHARLAWVRICVYA
jgi:hypothetical protein